MITQILEPVIWYDYKGDEIAWDGEQYLSICCEGAFPSLDEMDAFWEDYLNEVQKDTLRQLV